MLKQNLLFLRSLLFVSAAAVIAACSGGGSHPDSILPPDASGQQSAPIGQPIGPMSTTATTPGAPTVVQSRGGGGTCATSNHVTLASQPAAGDLIVIYPEVNWSYSLTAPSGFSTKYSTTNDYFHVAEFYKIATGTEGTSYTVGSNCSGKVFTWVVADIRGENQSNPFDRDNLKVDTATGITTFATASLTPSHANDLPVAVFELGNTSTSISSFSPTTWTLRASGSYFEQRLYSGPATGTTAVQFKETTSTASKYPSFETLDLINPSGTTTTTTATPDPVASSTPVPTATSTPVPTVSAAPVAAGSSPYVLNGCPIYTANDWFTTNLATGGSSYVSNTVDPNSANIIKNLISAHGGSLTLDVNASTTAVDSMGETANVATSSTPMYNVSASSFYDDPWSDDTAKTMPWSTSFKSEGTCGSGDCHTIVITGASGNPSGTHPCMDYETYAHSYSLSGSTFSTQYFSVHNLSQPYNNQLQSTGGVTVADIPLLGTADVGQDASAPSINHIAYVVIPGPYGVAEKGRVAPAGFSASCSSYCSYPIPYGARLRLNPSKYTCPSASTNPQAHKLCVQLETYGMIVADQTGSSSHYIIPVGRNPDGTNPWNASDINAISSTGGHGIPLQDFDVMTLGAVK